MSNPVRTFLRVLITLIWEVSEPYLEAFFLEKILPTITNQDEE